MVSKRLGRELGNSTLFGKSQPAAQLTPTLRLQHYINYAHKFFARKGDRPDQVDALILDEQALHPLKLLRIQLAEICFPASYNPFLIRKSIRRVRKTF
ncbi:hypothetical protein AM500_19025 [Bacillus sp. FJAT-18017]|nr:hypothetical protein AM500_19025 [Bacillus sp. FJAT-18017]